MNAIILNERNWFSIKIFHIRGDKMKRFMENMMDKILKSVTLNVEKLLTDVCVCVCEI